MKKLLITTGLTIALTTNAFSANYTEEACQNFNQIKNYTQTLKGSFDKNTTEGRANISAIEGKAIGFEEGMNEIYGSNSLSFLKNAGLGSKTDLTYKTMYLNHYFFIKYLEKEGTNNLQHYLTFVEGRMLKQYETFRDEYNDDMIVDYILLKALENLDSKFFNAFRSDAFIKSVFLNKEPNGEQVFSTEYSIHKDKDLQKFFRYVMLKEYDKANKMLYTHATMPKDKESYYDNAPAKSYNKNSWRAIIDYKCYRRAFY